MFRKENTEIREKMNTDNIVEEITTYLHVGRNERAV
jgi:hypothetical protein